jgi:hypothetical protein
MRSRVVVCAAAAVAATVAGCGAGGHFVAATPAASPVDLDVFISNSRVQLSPARLGAGPVLLLVTNQSSRSETLTVNPARGSPVASTGPINPDSTAQVQVNLTTPGDYALSAERTTPARLRIGPARPGGSGALLRP